MSLPPPSWSMVSDNNSAGKGLISSLRPMPLGSDSLPLASLTSSLLNRSASSAKHPTPPGTPLYALLSLPCSRVGLRPLRRLLDRLRGFWRLCGCFYGRDPLQGGGQQPTGLSVGLALGLQLLPKCGDKLGGAIFGRFRSFGCIFGW